jgi:hypothetical protein
MTSHWQERTLRDTLSEVVPVLSPLAASPTPSLEVSNAPVSPSSTQEQILGVTPYEVTPEVSSTPLLGTTVLPPCSPSDHSLEIVRLPSAVEISSSRFDPQLSLDEGVLIRPTLLLEASLTVHPTPSLDASLNVTGHSSSSSQPPGLTPVASESSSSRLETPLSFGRRNPSRSSRIITRSFKMPQSSLVAIATTARTLARPFDFRPV